MKKLVTLMLMLGSTSIIYGQTSTNEGLADRDVWFGNLIRELPSRPAETTGSYYLDDSWKVSNITLISKGQVKGYPTKLDLKQYELDIQVGDEIKVVQLLKVKEFKWADSPGDSSKFVNTEHLYGAVDGTGRMMEELVGNTFSLYKHMETYIQEANYNKAMGVGQQDNQIKLKKEYYLSKEGRLWLVSPKLKKNRELFGDHYSKVVAFTKANKLKFNREEDLIEVIKFLNGLNT
ncbi:MAG: hypothetical protein AAFN93_05000 [Bacteroidota bacterium]